MQLTEQDIQLYLQQGWYAPIPTNIHKDDRPEWGMWECLREIVQNALDETEAYRVKRMELAIERADLEVGRIANIPSLVIEDEGEGMYITNLLLGGGEKPSWVRGRFGEGLKYACLVALREGYDMDIFTVGTQIRPFIHLRAIPEPRLGTVKEVPILGFLYRKYPDWEKGTSIRVIGYEGTDYPERFAVNRTPTWSTEINPKDAPPEIKRVVGIYDDPEETEKKLYVRDIYVMDWAGLFSYNVWDVTLTRERNTPQSDSDLYAELGNMWIKCDNKALVRKLLSLLNQVDRDIPEVDKLEPYARLDGDLVLLWRGIWMDVYGEKTCLWTDEAAAKRAEWEGYKVIRIGKGWRYTLKGSGVVPYDQDVFKAHLLKRALPDEEFETRPRQLAILELMRDLGTAILELYYPRMDYPAVIAAELTELDTTGAYLSKGIEEEAIKITQAVIALSIEILSDVERTLQTFIHEMAHHTSHGAVDLTKPHLHEIGRVGAFMVSLMVSSEYYRDIFRDLRLAQMSHTRETEEREILERVQRRKEIREAEKKGTEARVRTLEAMTEEQREKIRDWEAF